MNPNRGTRQSGEMSYRLTNVELIQYATDIAAKTPLNDRAILADRIRDAMVWAITREAQTVLDRPTHWSYYKRPWWCGGGYVVTYLGQPVARCRFDGTAHGLVSIMRYEEPDVDWTNYARPR